MSRIRHLPNYWRLSTRGYDVANTMYIRMNERMNNRMNKRMNDSKALDRSIDNVLSSLFSSHTLIISDVVSLLTVSNGWAIVARAVGICGPTFEWAIVRIRHLAIARDTDEYSYVTIRLPIIEVRTEDADCVACHFRLERCFRFFFSARFCTRLLSISLVIIIVLYVFVYNYEHVPVCNCDNLLNCSVFCYA